MFASGCSAWRHRPGGWHRRWRWLLACAPLWARRWPLSERMVVHPGGGAATVQTSLIAANVAFFATDAGDEAWRRSLAPLARLVAQALGTGRPIFCF